MPRSPDCARTSLDQQMNKQSVDVMSAWRLCAGLLFVRLLVAQPIELTTRYSVQLGLGLWDFDFGREFCLEGFSSFPFAINIIGCAYVFTISYVMLI